MQIYSTVQKFHAGRDPLLYYFHLIPNFLKTNVKITFIQILDNTRTQNFSTVLYIPAGSHTWPFITFMPLIFYIYIFHRLIPTEQLWNI